MGAAESIERAYSEDRKTGIAMWRTLLRAAGSRLRSKEKKATENAAAKRKVSGGRKVKKHLQPPLS